MKVGMKNIFCCSLLLVFVLGACFHSPFVAFCCSSLLLLVFEIESVLSQKSKQTNAFGCSFWLLVARFGFRWYEKPNEQQKEEKSEWKPGFRATIAAYAIKS